MGANYFKNFNAITIKWVSLFSVSSLVVSCASLERPYQADVMSVNEAGSDQSATITLSSPTLYGRENLINDRRKEEEFLKDKLAQTTIPGFRVSNSSIQRNLSDTIATSISASVKYDPTNIATNRLQQARNERNLELDNTRSKYLTGAYEELLELEKTYRNAMAQKSRLDASESALKSQLNNLVTSEIASDDKEKLNQKKELERLIFDLELQQTQNDSELASVASRTNTLKSSLGIEGDANEFQVAALTGISANPAAIDTELKKIKQVFSSNAAGQNGTFNVRTPQRVSEPKTYYSALNEQGTGEIEFPQTSLEELRDIQSYRNELRAAIAEATLDDLHDYLGNALYRLNFKMLVAPGPNEAKQKYGVVNVEVSPPVVTYDQLSELYLTWIQYVSSTLNEYNNLDTDNNNEAKYIDYAAEQNAKRKALKTGYRFINAYEGVGKERKLFDLLKLDLLELDDLIISKIIGDNKINSCYLIASELEYNTPANSVDSIISDFNLTQSRGTNNLRLRKDDDVDFGMTLNSKEVCENSESRKIFLKTTLTKKNIRALFGRTRATNGNKETEVILVVPYGYSKTLVDLSINLESIEEESGYEYCNKFLQMQETISASLRGARPTFQYVERYNLQSLFYEAFEDAIADLKETCENKPINSVELQSPLNPSLQQFMKLVANDTIEGTYVLNGNIRAIGAFPLESSQSIGTTANSARSFEAALSLAGTLPLQGIGASGGFQNLRDASAAVAALERIPRLVGYADEAPLPNGSTKDSNSHFGWIIGPKARLSTENQNIILEQVLTAMRTSAEISVPGWWPEMNLRASSYWAGNFGESETRSNSLNIPLLGDLPLFNSSINSTNTELGFNNISARSFEVPIPTTNVDFDGLTQFLINDIGSRGKIFREPQIKKVTPSAISVCTGNTTFVIEGKNIWRGAEVYIGGHKANNVNVLPNMQGLSAQIDVGKTLMTNGGRNVNDGNTLENVNFEESAYASVTVATRDGVLDTEPIKLIYPAGTTKSQNCSNTNVPVEAMSQSKFNYQEKTEPLSIVNYQPKIIFTCGGDVTITSTLRGSELGRQSDIEATLNGVNGQSSYKTTYNKDGVQQGIVKSEFDQNNLPKSGQMEYVISAEGAGLDIGTVELRECPK